MSNAYKFFAGLNGTNVITVGDEPSVYQYTKTEIQTAINACPEGGVVLCEPGTYTITAAITSAAGLAVNKPITIMCDDPYRTALFTSALATQTVKVNVPATTAATSVTVNFKGIEFYNSGAGYSFAMDNNGGSSIPITLNAIDCVFAQSGAVCIDIAHTTVALTTEAEIINFSNCIVGTVALAHPLAVDFFNCYQCVLSDIITMSAEATASNVNLIDCEYYSATPTVGGNAAQIVNVFGPIYNAAGGGGALTKGSTADFTDLGFQAAGPGFTNCGLYA